MKKIHIGKEMDDIGTVFLVVLVWIAGGVGIFIMKKIEPDNKIYSVWVLFIEVVFTAFVAWYLSAAQ